MTKDEYETLKAIAINFVMMCSTPGSESGTAVIRCGTCGIAVVDMTPCVSLPNGETLVPAVSLTKMTQIICDLTGHYMENHAGMNVSVESSMN